MGHQSERRSEFHPKYQWFKVQNAIKTKHMFTLFFPSFQYSFNGISVSDKISATEPSSLVRKLKILDAPKGLYLRLAAATEIASLGNGLYAIGNKSYYITLDNSQQPIIRKSKLGMELIVAIPADASTYSYSITW